MTTHANAAQNASAAGNRRAALLADRIEEGAAALAAFAETLSDAEWRTPVSESGRTGRTAGVIVHHVASVYPIEIDLARAERPSPASLGMSLQTCMPNMLSTRPV